MQVQRVDIAHVNQVWNLVEPFIANAMEHSCGDYTVEQIKTLVVMGHWTLLVAVDDDGGFHLDSPRLTGCGIFLAGPKQPQWLCEHARHPDSGY